MAPPRLAAGRTRDILIAVGVVLLTVLTLLPAAARAASDIRFGTWSPGEPYWSSLTGVQALQDRTGRDVEIVNWYQNWGGGSWIASVQAHLVRTVTDSGRTPLLTWEPWNPAAGVDQPAYRLARIADGTHDAYMASFARGLRDLGTTVYLRPMHEMNGTWYPWAGGVNANTPADYVAAWRRMHDVFAAQGATNVRWVWSPNNIDMSADRPMEAFYPGSSYVDVLAVDGYNWGSTAPEFGGWQTFTQVIRPAYDRLQALGPQPIWIAEIGTAPEGGDKPAWIRDMWARAAQMDRLEAIVWFNENKERDWRADPSADVAAAFAPSLEPAPAPTPAPAAPPAQPTPEPTPQPAPQPAPEPTPQPTRDAAQQPAGYAATPAAPAGPTAAPAATSPAPTSSAAGSTTARLRLRAARRVRSGSRLTLSWTTSGTRGRSAHATVARWVVYLDGRRVRTLRAGAAQKLRHRVRATGTHRWRVEARSADGRPVLTATRAFRVIRAR